MMDADLLEGLEEEMIPSKTFKIVGNRIQGLTDGLDAIRQTVDKILHTERFVYPIYSDNVGAELERFIGADYDFIEADLERTIEDALTADDRIEGITDFEMNQTASNTLACKFIVDTVEGLYAQETEVDTDGYNTVR